jgi:predicted metal-dependent hydrolase
MNKTEYLLYRSKRKTISVEISREAKIIVRAPLKMTVKDIEAFLNSKSEWINKHLLEARKRIEEAPAPLSEDEKNKLKKRAKQFLLLQKLLESVKIYNINNNKPKHKGDFQNEKDFKKYHRINTRCFIYVKLCRLFKRTRS